MQILQELLSVTLASVASLVALFLLTRLGGKRQIAQMSLFDYVNSITIGSIAAEMATNLEQWYRPLTAMTIYGVAACLVHFAAYKSMAARLFLSGRAIVLMEDGTIRRTELARSKIDLNEFLAQARAAGYYDLNEIESAVLETNGQISFLPRSNARPACCNDLNLSPDPVSLWYDLVIDGNLMEEHLKSSGRSRDWLEGQLRQNGIPKIEDAFYAACDRQGRFFACKSGQER